MFPGIEIDFIRLSATLAARGIHCSAAALARAVAAASPPPAPADVERQRLWLVCRSQHIDGCMCFASGAV